MNIKSMKILQKKNGQTKTREEGILDGISRKSKSRRRNESNYGGSVDNNDDLEEVF